MPSAGHQRVPSVTKAADVARIPADVPIILFIGLFFRVFENLHIRINLQEDLEVVKLELQPEYEMPWKSKVLYIFVCQI